MLMVLIREMYRAGPHAGGQSTYPKAFASKHDLAHGAIVGQHADDDAAVEQVGNVGRRPQAERLEFTDPLGATDICNHLAARRGEIRSHRRAHPTEADKSEVVRDLEAPALL
jgi:hypothetical protein